MISPVSSGPAVSQAVSPQSAAQSRPQAAQAPQDTVTLSPKAQAHASGDVDHDGDSH
jgi:hypothetical protein